MTPLTEPVYRVWTTQSLVPSRWCN